MEWRENEGFEVSEYGDIKLNGVLLNQSEIKEKGNRYKSIKSSKKPYEWIRTHKLVYRAFIGPINEEMVIDHVDENRNNNHYSNLEQITQGENIIRYYTNMAKKKLTKTGKICCKCGSDKPLTQFYLKAKKDIREWNPDKWRPYCKECMKK
jgi:hypothetical protein